MSPYRPQPIVDHLRSRAGVRVPDVRNHAHLSAVELRAHVAHRILHGFLTLAEIDLRDDQMHDDPAPAIPQPPHQRPGVGVQRPSVQPIVKSPGLFCMRVCICMHPGMHTKKARKKARKPLYIKEKTKFLSLVCIVCINIRGFLPFSRILYRGMMHTMHTRPRTTPGTLEPSRNGKRRCMHPRMHTDAYTPAGMHTRPRPCGSPPGSAANGTGRSNPRRACST